MLLGAHKILPIALTFGLLAGVGIDTYSRPRPADAEPYHRRAYEESQRIPLKVGDWIGSDEPLTPAAKKLLKPNVALQRRFLNQRTGQVASLLLVQCKNARDMEGHYPPVCYPGQGWNPAASRQVLVPAGDQQLHGREYRFDRVEEGRTTTTFVWNILVLPSGRFVDDMDEIGRAAGDRLRFFYGAAQVQVVLPVMPPAALDERERQAVYGDLVGAIWPMLQVLSSGGSK